MGWGHMAISATGAKPAASAAPSKPATDKPADTKPAGDTPVKPADQHSGVSQAKAGAKEASTKPSASGATPSGDAHAADHSTGGAHTGSDPGAHGGHATVIPPARNDPRFVAGTTGPKPQHEGDAPTVKIPDGPGFGGLEGRKQNGNDKEQNNYSVTDANYNNQLGLLAKDPDTGKPMTYVQHIQTYNAAGYLETYSPDVYKKLAANQNAGRGTILGAAAHIMGLTQTADASEQGVDVSGVPMTVPGTNLDARREVANPKDSGGQNWARMHHAESHWGMLKSMTDMGVDQAHALRFSGDDAVSGAGRLNGVNNQDGTSGFNAGELKVYQEAAQYDASGKVILAMMQGHNHDTGQAPDALTDPAINKQLGLASNDRSVTAERAAAIAAGLNSGAVKNENNNNDNNNDAGNDGGGGAEPDVTAAEATGGGDGEIGTVDEQDPVAALAEITQLGFADGVTGVAATRLALLLQQLLLQLLQGGQLSPEILAALKELAPQLAASADPALQALGKVLESVGQAADPQTGALSPEFIKQLAPAIAQFVVEAGAAFTPELTAAAPELVATAQAGQQPGAAGAAATAADGAALAQPGGATLPKTGAAGADLAAAGSDILATSTAGDPTGAPIDAAGHAHGVAA